MLPRGTENLLVAGRCIGADRQIMGSLRVMPCCLITGTAAGAAAAEAVRSGKALREIDIRALQRRLRGLGLYFHEAPEKDCEGRTEHARDE
ncbi:MAG: FAD-dependent oxidoreductase [Oscillospiraceae bacterium]|nr:FAD-dependent oxidoreductase [Oscillospiraceae bacterium]